jgi:ferrous iron transport protein A
VRTLSQLVPGATALVARLEGDPAVVRRLGSLGFRPGTPVTCERRAPMGDPTIYRLRCYEVCLRRREAGCIVLETA